MTYIKDSIIKKWIEDIKPQIFSFYENVDRTNYYLELYYCKFNGFIGFQPAVNELLCKLLNSHLYLKTLHC